MGDIKPYHSSAGKKAQVEQMFDNISPRYDFLNRFLSLGIDRTWRRKLLAKVQTDVDGTLLDLATGTGDIVIKAAKKYPKMDIIGLDISFKMLEIAQEKIEKKKLDAVIRLQHGDAENIPFEDNSIDVVTCGFGVRNFENLERGLKEIYRVLKPGGQCLILEFSQPQKFPFTQIYHFYFKYVLPLIGKKISSDDKAYQYLYDSAMTFPAYESFNELLKSQGFIDPQFQALTFGVCCIYSAKK